MKTATIHDRVPLSTRKYTDDGYLRAEAALTRSGVFEYDAHDLGVGPKGKTVKVLRTEESSFHADTIASARGTPITVEHPKNGVSPNNWHKEAVGNVVGEPRVIDKKRLGADVLIGAKRGIAAVQDGVEELSIGYTLAFEKAGKDSDYDYVSKGPILINHAALVDKTRAGSTVRIFDKEGRPMDENTIAKAVKDALKECLGDSKPAGTTIDATKLADAVASAISPHVEAVKKIAEDAAKRDADARAERERKDMESRAKEAADKLVADTIAKRDAYHAAISAALPFIPEAQRQDAMSKPLKDVLVMAVGDAIPGAKDMSEDTLRGALLVMRKDRSAGGAPGALAATAPTSMPPKPAGGVTNFDGGKTTVGTDRNSAYEAYVNSFKTPPAAPAAAPSA